MHMHYNQGLKKSQTHTHSLSHCHHHFQVISSGAEGDDSVGVTSLMGKHVGDSLTAIVYTNTFCPTQSVDSDGGMRGSRRRGNTFLQDISSCFCFAVTSPSGAINYRPITVMAAQKGLNQVRAAWFTFIPAF